MTGNLRYLRSLKLQLSKGLHTLLVRHYNHRMEYVVT